jgi:aspartyl-tRNA(Asn)/glutamyl-tRNA(Gln) amidotransferase subunit A
MLSLSLTALHDKLRAREISSEEITKLTLAEIDKQNPTLNAFLTISSEEALLQARAADARLAKEEVTSPLLGIPAAIKDSLCTKGIRTTCASKMLENFIPPYSATCVEKLLHEGAVIVGKTNTDEFTSGSSTEHSAFGPTKNPVDTTRVPGGSSGGSAAAVKAGLSYYALGTDTGGSIRLPASFCGTVGLKVTYGRVSRYGAIAMASSYDTIGPLARTVEDTALVLQAIAGRDERDSTTPDIPVPSYRDSLSPSLKGMRLGIPKEYFIEGGDPEVRTLVEAAIAQCEALGATLVPVSLPHTKYALDVYYITQPAEQSTNLSRFDGLRYGPASDDAKDLQELYIKNRALFGDEVKRRILVGTFVLSQGSYEAYYKKAQKVRRAVLNDFTTVFQEVDALLTPTAATPAFPLGSKLKDPLSMYLADILTIPASAAGVPALSVPCGTTKDGLPVGLQIIGPHFREDILLHVGYAYEQSLM